MIDVIQVTVAFARQVCDDIDPDISYLEQDCFDGPGEKDGRLSRCDGVPRFSME